MGAAAMKPTNELRWVLKAVIPTIDPEVFGLKEVLQQKWVPEDGNVIDPDEWRDIPIENERP